MNDTKVLIEKIKEGIQEKKGKKIVVADLTSIEDTICKYFVIRHTAYYQHTTHVMFHEIQLDIVFL